MYLLFYLLITIAKLIRTGSSHTVIAENLLLKQQLHLIDIGFQRSLSLGPVLERPLDRCFTREKIPLIERVEETAFAKPGLRFRFAFSRHVCRQL